MRAKDRGCCGRAVQDHPFEYTRCPTDMTMFYSAESWIPQRPRLPSVPHQPLPPHLSFFHRHGLPAGCDLLVDAGQEVLRDAEGVL